MTARVLLVDDTEHVRQMLEAMLNVDGFEVVGSVGDGAAAVDAAVSTDPDVVVIDYMMPSIDGLETARRIREARPHQRIILYSAFIDAAVERRAAEIGVAVVLGKVDGLAQLETEIQRLTW